MNVIKYESKKNYYLGQGIAPKRLEIKKYKLLGKLENYCDDVCEFVSDPERYHGVKTINSDPEFARWEGDHIDI